LGAGRVVGGTVIAQRPEGCASGLPVPRERKAPTHFKNGTVTGGEA